MFKVSIKGIVAVDGRHLLRMNERGEYELLGGKLEHRDATLANRVRQEFLEESGVVVEPQEIREPWFYVFGDRPILIVPMVCDAVRIPKALHDQDGGRLEWVGMDQLESIPLPEGYLASIRNEHPSLMTWEGKRGPSYADDLFSVTLVVRRTNTEKHYQLAGACDFAHRLEELGNRGASFAEVRYGGTPELQIVFDASVCPTGCPQQ
ncbi:MAG: hypothetical protein IKG18_01645 [Atopobiaceae bacterium]|nr:hypothetical protein [Atopobiaceae bacterium]